MNVIENATFDAERAFYESAGVTVKNCIFEGPADGESAFKESRDVTVLGCTWRLRYPFWHDVGVIMQETELTDTCRAAFWYSRDIRVSGSKLHGTKALRECANVSLTACDLVSEEFGWSCQSVTMTNCRAEGAYFMMRSTGLRLEGVTLAGKYSFQYIEDAEFVNCHFDTKDAFWHAKRVVVRDSVIRGEYLGWYAEDITFERCRIIGTQPLCYCKNLTMIDCEMVDADLAFEKSSVQATLKAPVISIKNPLSGCITLPSVGEIIREDKRYRGEILVTG